VGSRAVLDAVVKRKIPSPRREPNSRTPILQPDAFAAAKFFLYINFLALVMCFVGLVRTKKLDKYLRC